MAKSPSTQESVRFVADPPPAQDGRLTRLTAMQPWQGWHKKEQVVYGNATWKGEQDLSGEVILAWDLSYLYVGIKVKDDVFLQPFSGANLYQGDHAMLLLDLPRQAQGERSSAQMIRIGLSPGNLQEDKTLPPEIYRYRGNWKTGLTGENTALPNSRIQALRTGDGYQMESAIAWKDLGMERPEEGALFGYDVAISDSDDLANPRQEKLASLISTSPWGEPDPERLLEGVLAQSSGEVSPLKRRSPDLSMLTGLELIAPGEKWREEVSGRPLTQELVVKARIDHPVLGGGTGVMEVFLNGRKLGIAESQNRLGQFMMGVSEQSTYGYTGWFVYYAADFAPISPVSLYYTSDFDPFLFRFNVANLWKPEGNVVEIVHTGTAKGALAVEAYTSDQLSIKVVEATPEPAPTGEIPTVEPQATLEKALYQTRLLEGGAIAIQQQGNGSWVLESKYSNRNPSWNSLKATATEDDWKAISVTDSEAKAKTSELAVRRELKRFSDRILVTDHLTNLTDGDLPVMFSHRFKAEADQIYLSGRRVAHSVFHLYDSEAPTALALRKGYGLGLVLEDDIFRSQGGTFVENGWVGLENRHFVLTKGASVALEFSIYPLEKAEPFLFVNRIRKHWGTNFTLPGGFGIIGINPTTDRMSDEELATRIKAANARYVILGNTYHTGRSDTADGVAAFYRQKESPLFVPYIGNAFAKLQEKLVDITFELGFDGVFWDETEYSAYKYDYSTRHWDGVSGEIDPETHQLRRRISNVALLSQPWRISYAEKIMRKGGLVGNGSPHTRGMTQLHFPRFTETGAIVNLVKAQLYTPIALGDSMTEKNGVDVYRNVVRALNYGCLTYWYSLHNTLPSYPDSPLSHLYPFTPIELGEGYLIGKERIITNRSGLFGWGDQSEFNAIVYDGRGRRSDQFEIPRREVDGKSYAEIRIPGGYIVILIKK